MNNKVQQNVIGTDSTETVKLGNQMYGVEAHQGANNNLIGGTVPTLGNTIAYNGATLNAHGHGVVVPAGASDAIRENTIFENAGRGIDLVNLASPDTFTINDFQSAAQPIDFVQDAPAVTGVTTSGSSTVISWTLNSTPNTTFAVDFFANTAPNPSGFGDGRTFLTTNSFTTDGDGNVSFNLTVSSTNKYISATATSSTNNTSEFSMVDTDADGLADAWETRGIDFDEDGTVDLTLPGANPNRKDVYVEIDSMRASSRIPTRSLW